MSKKHILYFYYKNFKSYVFNKLPILERYVIWNRKDFDFYEPSPFHKRRFTGKLDRVPFEGEMVAIKGPKTDKQNKKESKLIKLT